MDRRLQLSEGALRDQMAVGEDADAVGQAFGDFNHAPPRVRALRISFI
jgi:hypothetical protein